MFTNYATLQGVDRIVPVDIYIPAAHLVQRRCSKASRRLHEKIRAGIPPAYEIREVSGVTLGRRRRVTGRTRRSSRHGSRC